MKITIAVAAAAALFALGCSKEGDSDQMARARSNLKIAPCSSTPAIAGVAGVNANPRAVYLGDWIVVSICNMQELVKQADAEQQPVTLFIEGIDSGNQPSGVDFDSGQMTFILDRNEDNKDLWKPLLYNPLFDSTVTVRISAGIHGGRPLPRAEHANATVVLKKLYFDWSTAVWLGVLLVIVGSLIGWARNSDMLRDGPPIDGVRQPFSLSRAQMAWWLFLILIGYNYIWLVTGDRDTIAPSLLALMGISAITAIAAEAIPTKGPKTYTSSGFWRDLVTDERGTVALDRFQIVAWTIVLGGIFLGAVIWELNMPEFSATMLALMGISSGTYLGFKLPTRADDEKTP
ncbi:MAG: hypothetical protein AABO58_22370 [Acidobacteriota bacterium]